MRSRSLSIPTDGECELVQRSGSTEVLRFERAGQPWFLKIYRYRGLKGPLRGAFRNTFARPSRAAREDRALRHLAAHGVQDALAGGYSERRCLGFLREARLLTRGFGAEDLAARLRRGPLAEDELLGLAALLAGQFSCGLRDPDIVARNLLLAGPDVGRRWAKIDASSSWIVRRPLRPEERRRDLARLLQELAAAGQSDEALAELELRTRARS